jgi:uncharacterized cupin superfamily protein
MDEARLERTENGVVPSDDGWYVLNVREMAWESVEGGGTWCGFASTPQLGIGVHVLNPGEAPGYYHAETNQEGFLVLAGECIAIVEGEERRMGPWDYLHCPPGTAHITVGAGDGPCAIMMVGTRSPDAVIDYIPEPAAAKHGWAVESATQSPREAYAERAPIVPARPAWPPT